MSAKFDCLVTTLNTQVRTPILTFEEFSVMQPKDMMCLESGDLENHGNMLLTTKSKIQSQEEEVNGKYHYNKKHGHMAKECHQTKNDKKDETSIHFL